jgi:tetratricopeptide (TPR) repeat protein
VAAAQASGDAVPVDGLDCRLLSALPAGQPSAAMGSWYCRLFRRRPHVRFQGRIHEQVAPSIRRGGGRIERSAITIVHEGYAVIDAAKIQRNRALLELALADDPHDAFALLNLGLTEQAQGNWVRATSMLERALAAPARPLDLGLRAIAFAHLAECRCAGRRWREAASAAGAALELEPTLGLARYLRGRALFELGEVDAAAACFASCLGEGPDALEMRLHPHLPAIGLAICRLRARRFDDARRVLAPVADGDASGEALFHLGNANLGLHRLEDAASAYRGALARGWRDPDLARRLALCQRLAPASA